MGAHVGCVGAADVNEAVPAGFYEEPAHRLGRQSQLLAVLIAFGDDSGAATEIFQLEVKNGKFYWRKSVALFAKRRRQVENIMPLWPSEYTLRRRRQ